MTKIFATKALSMVLCFVMLFMGAPVTAWADGEPSAALYFTADANGDASTAITTGQSEGDPYMLAVGSTIYLAGTDSGDGRALTPSVIGEGNYDDYIETDGNSITGKASSGDMIIKFEAAGASEPTNNQATLYVKVVPPITVEKDGISVTGEDIMLAAVGGTLTLTAEGFTGDNVTWSLSTYADTWVSFGKDADSKPIVSTDGKSVNLQLDTLPAFDTTVKVKAIGLKEDSETATVTVSLKKPDALTVDLPDDAGAKGISQVNGVVTVSRGATTPSLDFRLFVDVDGVDGDVGWQGFFESSDSAVLSTSADDDLSIFSVLRSGSAVVTVSHDEVDDMSVAFRVNVESGIANVSLYNNDGAEIDSTTATATVNDTITAKVFSTVDETGEIADAGVTWTVTDVSGTDVTESACITNGNTLTFTTAGTYTVTAKSSFDQSKAVEQQITVDALEPFTPTIEANPAGAVAPGDEIIYTISYKNYTREAANVTITSALDPNVEFFSASDGGVYDEDGHTVTWTLTDVEADTEATVPLTVKVLEDALASKGGPGKVSASATVQVGTDYGFDANKVEHTVEEADGIISVEDSAGSGVTNGGSFELDSFGNGKLTVTIEPEDAEDATVTVKVNGEVNEAVASYEKGVININGAADGATLTITAVKEGYTFDDFTLTLLVPEPPVESVTISGQAEPAISAGTLTLDAVYAKE